MKLPLPINFVARQSVWALEHQQPPQFLDVPQAQRLNALLRLDYSPRSIERIQQWLDKQRALRVAAGRTVFDAERDHDVLMLLGFYVAEWVARTMGGVPSWSQVGEAFIVNFPEDRKASVGMVSLMGVVHHAWVTDGAQLQGALAMLINVRVLDQPDQALPPARPDRDTAFKARYAALPAREQDAVFTAAPGGGVPPALRSYLEEQRLLWQHGHFVCGSVVQAHMDLYRPAYVGLRVAEVVYDPTNSLQYDDLRAIAQAILRLKDIPDDTPLPPEAEGLRRYLRAETEGKFSEDLPLPLFGYPLQISSLWVD